MTNPTPEAATFTSMTLHRLPLALLAAASLTAPLPAQATDPDAGLRELLRDALYTEEVTRDREAAAKQYEALLSKHDAQRAFAASALFRLAEVRRKQDHKDEAIALYQRLLREFPAAEAEAKLARENLAILGAKIESPAAPAADEETIELQRLQQWVESSPDRLKDPDLVLEAVQKGQLRSIEFLLEAGAAAREPSKLLEEAVTTGNLRTTTLILDYPFKSGDRGVDDALFTAVTLEYQDIAKLLLSRGADPHRQGWYRIDENVIPPSSNRGQMTALHVAVRKRNLALCKLLLDHKADPNRFAEKPSIPTKDSRLPDLPAGTPLHDAVVSSLEIARLLIDHGADINAAHASTGITPLFVALKLSEPAEAIGFLIEKGAKLEAASTAPSKEAGSTWPQRQVFGPPGPARNDRPPSPLPAGSTALRYALEWGKVPAALQLLKAGASAKHPGILSAAVRTLHPELVREVLAKGALEADPDADLIRELAMQDFDAPASKARETILDLLQKHGAEPQPEWVEQHFEGATLSILPLLYQRFLIPRLQERPAVTVIGPFAGSLSPIVLAAGGGSEPGSCDQLLRNPAIRWPMVIVDNNENFPTRFTLWRKNAEEVEGRLDGSDPFPELQWGDVLEFSPDWEGLGGQPQIYGRAVHIGLPPDIQWHVRKRIRSPITVEIDGVSRKLTLRGDRMIFDPGSAEVPLVGAAQLMSLLWQPPFVPSGQGEPKVTLIRQGWPEVRIPWGKVADSDFPLEAGDTLRLTAPAGPADAEKLRKTQLLITSPGIPFVRRHSFQDIFESPADSSLPTLIQTLVDVTGYWSKNMRHAPDDPAEFASWLINGDFPLHFLPHPDYSKIRIRRLNDDGSETVIPVDLAATIAAAGPDLTADSAREKDILLRHGDIVEVPQLPGQAGKPWQGPTAAEAAFFAKALDCRIQFIDGDKPLELREIRYHSPRFVEIEGQGIPLWPDNGTPTLNALRALGDLWDTIEITRKGAERAELGPAGALYLRDGDMVQARGGRAAPQQRQPRPRVLPPPIPNR